MDGDAGVAQTIGVMRQLYDQALKNPEVRAAAVDITGGSRNFDPIGQLTAIFDYVTGNIRFLNDPVTKETLFPPEEILKAGAGDCDDQALLVASLAGAIGYDARLVTVASDPADPGRFTHIYAEVLADGQWIPMDTARPGAAIGRVPEFAARAQWWALADESSGELGCACESMRGGMGDAASIAAAILQAGAGIARAAGGGPQIYPGQPGYIPPAAASSGSSSGLLWLLLGGGLLYVATR
jgi:transglutaminase-like putative cysteine protease